MIDPNYNNIELFQKESYENLRYLKKLKDRIVFFIGSLFTMATIAHGIFSYQIINAQKAQVDNDFFENIFLSEYIIVTIFFLLLFMYYTYINIQEKLFLINLQCSEIKSNLPFLPLSFFKEVYINIPQKNFIRNGSVTWKPRLFRDLGNIFVIIAYSGFSLFPLIAANIYESFQVSRLKLGLTFLILLVILLFLYIVLKIGGSIIVSSREKICERWDVEEEDLLKTYES